MRFLLAVALVVGPTVIGMVASRGGDPAVPILLVAATFAVAGGVAHAHRGLPRALGMAALIFALGLLPAVAILVGCFVPLINPDAPCIR